jgi:hypothetical protein
MLADFAAGRGRQMVVRARDFDERCGERPTVVAMAYRGACAIGDFHEARAAATRLREHDDEVGAWRLLPCPVLDGHPVRTERPDRSRRHVGNVP